MIKKEMTYKQQGLILLDILITGQSSKKEHREISFTLPLFFDKLIVDKIEAEWRNISSQKNKPNTIPLNDMQVLNSYMPKVEMMNLNQYIRDNFSVSDFITYYIRNIIFQNHKWHLVMNIETSINDTKMI